MPRMTKKALRTKVEEMLDLAPIVNRYKELEKELKQAMPDLKVEEVDIPGKGRLFVSVSERVTVSPELAVKVLGEEMAAQVIFVKKSVPNDILKAFVKVGKISQEQRDDLLAEADRKPVVSLHVRPLN